MFEQDLITRLKTVVPAVEGRVHVGNVPQSSAMPVLVIISVSSIPRRTLSGRIVDSNVDVQIAVVGDERYSSVNAAKDEMMAGLHGYRGAMGESDVKSCRCVSGPNDESVVDGTKTIRQLVAAFRFKVGAPGATSQ